MESVKAPSSNNGINVQAQVQRTNSNTESLYSCSRSSRKETGSGKTLAFGLPILQRLLEECEKVDKLLAENGGADERIAARGFLRALIITPTRELALQVTDHLKEVAKGTNSRVVPIVGRMSTEKQERLLKARPEIVVGTPGRLCELMSGREIHLIELHSLSFFVLDEADRMLENGHFHELRSIIDILPMTTGSIGGHTPSSEGCVTIQAPRGRNGRLLSFLQLFPYLLTSVQSLSMEH